MVATTELKIPMYYDEDKQKWLIDEKDKDLVHNFKLMVNAMNRKYQSIRDGSHSYVFGWLDSDLANKIQKRYPGEFEPDGDYFDTAIDDEALAGVWSLEDFYREVVCLNYDYLDGADSFENFKKEVLQ